MIHKNTSAKPVEQWGCAPADRDLDAYINYGIAVVNKPSGPTSHQVAAYVKEIFGLKKAGHSGTLDPKVTGVLPVCLGDGTKVLQAMLKTPKEYICHLHIHQQVDEKIAKEAILSFIGEIEQLPPVKSAVKRQLRKRTIYDIEIIEMDGLEVLFRVKCEAGTYIRKLCHDIGLKLEVGANMQQLLRTKASIFTQDDMQTMQEFSDAYYFAKKGDETKLRQIVKPVEAIGEKFKKIIVADQVINPLCCGVSLKVPGIVSLDEGIIVGERISIFSLKGEFVALAQAKMTSEQIAEAKKGEVCTTQRIIIDMRLYPRVSSS